MPEDEGLRFAELIRRHAAAGEPLPINSITFRRRRRPPPEDDGDVGLGDRSPLLPVTPQLSPSAAKRPPIEEGEADRKG